MDNPRLISYKIVLKFLTIYSNIDKIINFYFSKHQLSKKDKGFIKELVYGIIRNKKLLFYTINQYSDKKNNQKDKKLSSILLMGGYQIIFMNSVPSYASIFTSVELAKKYTKNKYAYVNAVLRRVNENGVPKLDLNFINKLSVQYSYPKLILNRWVSYYGKDKTKQLCKSNSKKQKIWIRANLSKCSIQDIINTFEANNIVYNQNNELNQYFNIEAINDEIIDLLNKGYIYIQNPSSGFIVKILDIKDNDTILDACAAPGGKLTHILDVINSTNKITAIENSSERFKILKNNIDKFNSKNIKLLNTDSALYNMEKFDKILIDAPCASSGTIGKNPDVKWIFSEEGINKNNIMQTRLLNNISKIVKLNGKIIYSTCSIENEENELIVKGFLKNNTNFVIEDLNKIIPEKYLEEKKYFKIFPNDIGYEGMFGVRLKRIK